MSRPRSAQRAHMMRSMHAAQHPLVVRQGMHPVGYGDGESATLVARSTGFSPDPTFTGRPVGPKDLSDPYSGVVLRFAGRSFPPSKSGDVGMRVGWVRPHAVYIPAIEASIPTVGGRLTYTYYTPASSMWEEVVRVVWGRATNPRPPSLGGYGYGYGYGMDMPSGGWPCLYKGVSGQTEAIKQAAQFIWGDDNTRDPSRWLDKPVSEGGASQTDEDAVEAAKNDGIFTDAFKTAVTNMQKADGYKFVDGVIGPETWGKIAPAGQNKGVNCPARYTGGGGGGAGAGGGKKTPSSLDTDRGGGSITDKAWFWPVAILVPTAAVIGGILFWPKKKSQ